MMKTGWSKLSNLLEQAVDFESSGRKSKEYSEFCGEEERTKRIEVEVEGKNGRTQTVAIDVSEDTDQVIQLKVPAGIKPGERISVDGPDGEKLRVAIPPGYGPGDLVLVPVPRRASCTGFVSWCKKKLEMDSFTKSKSAP